MGYFDGENFRHIDSSAYGDDQVVHAGLERTIHNAHLWLNSRGWELTATEWGQRRYASVRWSAVKTCELYLPAKTNRLEFWPCGRIGTREAGSTGNVYTEARLLGTASVEKTLSHTGGDTHSWKYEIDFPPSQFDRFALFQFRIRSEPVSVIESNGWGQIMPNGEFYLDLANPVHDSHAVRMKMGGLFDFLCKLSWTEQGFGEGFAMHPGRQGVAVNEGETLDTTDYHLFEFDHLDLAYWQPDCYEFKISVNDDALAPVDPEAARGNIAYDASESSFKHAINTNIVSGRPRPLAMSGQHQSPDNGTEWPTDYPRIWGVEGGGFTDTDFSHAFQMLPRESASTTCLIRTMLGAFHLQQGYTQGFQGSEPLEQDAGRVQLRATITTFQHKKGFSSLQQKSQDTFDRYFPLWPADSSGVFALTAQAQWLRYYPNATNGRPDEKWGAGELGYVFKDGHLFDGDIQFLTPVQYEVDLSSLTDDIPAFIMVSWSVLGASYRLLEDRATDEILIVSPALSAWEVI